MKLVSIVIPSYNASRYIKEAVDSALAQTYRNIEIIVVDDGSTDDTREVLGQCIATGKIRYIYQENRGLASARNTGIKNAKGDYIAFLDADDLFLPSKVEEQVEFLEKNQFDVCYCDLLHFTESEPKKFYHHRYKYPSGDVFGELLKRQFINPLTLLIRREVFEKYGYFDENLRRSEDYDLWLRWAYAGVRFYYLDKILAHYRIRSAGNLSDVASEPEMKEKNLFVFSRIGEKLTEGEWRKYNFDKILRRLRLKTAIAYLMVGNKNNALKFVDNALIKILIYSVPASLWAVFLQLARKIKHRLLLRKA